MLIRPQAAIGRRKVLLDVRVTIVKRECVTRQIEGHVRRLDIDLPDEKVFGRNC